MQSGFVPLLMHSAAIFRRLSRGLFALLLVSTVRAEEVVSSVEWMQAGGSVWVAVGVGFALCVAMIVVLARRLRGETIKRQKVENEAAEEKRRLNDILDNSRIGVLLVDRHSRHVDVNRAWCQMFGYRRREVRGKLTARDIAHPDEVDALEDHFKGLLAGKMGSLTQERRFVRKDGSIFWGLLSTSTVQDRNGKHMWVVAMITDIDAQKRIEEALRESEERLRFITENTHDVVWQLDRDLCFTYINGADERMRGYKREEVIGHHFKEIVNPPGHQIVDQALQLHVSPGGHEAEGSTESFEVQLCCQYGRRLWAEINSTPIRDHFGHVIGFIGVTRDATLRRETHDKLLEQTIRDPLTGLFNRRYLDESLDRELARAKRDNVPLSLLMIDLDHFKRLNDTHGHQAGDEVLRHLGELIRHGARRADLPCRYGGEEFLLVLPNVPSDIAADRAEKWRLAFEQEKIIFGDSLVLSATFSAGVATYPDHGDNCQSLIRAADQALYNAKHSGRNRVVVAPLVRAPIIETRRGEPNGAALTADALS